MKFALFTGTIGNFERDFGYGNVVKLERGVARKVSDEVADTLKFNHNIVFFDSIDENEIEFKKPKVIRPYKEIVKDVGIKKASEIYKTQEECV